MEWDAIGLNWERLSPLAQQQFTGCSEADLKAAGGSRDALNRCIAKTHGITEQEAAHITQEWALKLEADPGDVQPRPRVASRYPSTPQTVEQMNEAISKNYVPAFLDQPAQPKE